jgi:thiol-disulfide isomerase/thioredoxin
VRKHLDIVLAFTLGFVAYSPILPGSPAGLSYGNAKVVYPPAPEFSLTDLSGKKLDLAAYRGKVVLLDFWATWCAPCRSEIPSFVALQSEYRDRGFRIIGISLDDNARVVRAFQRQFKINYPVGIGDAALAERYGRILALPVTFLIGCGGRIHVKHEGKSNISRLDQEIRRLLSRSNCRETSSGN